MSLRSALAVMAIKIHHAQAAARLQQRLHTRGLILQLELILGALSAIQRVYAASLVCEHLQV